MCRLTRPFALAFATYCVCTFEMEKGTNGYLLLVVLWFLREGDVTIYGLYCSKRWDNDRIAIERFSDIYFIVSNPS